MKILNTHIKAPSLLLILWSVVQLWTYATAGILTELEAGKYIREANNLLDTGALSTEGFTFYLFEILLIAIFKTLTINIENIVFIHLLLNALATKYLWKIVNDLSNASTATIVTALFIIFLPIQQFNFQLQTESLFISLILFHTFFAIECTKGNKKALLGLIGIQVLLIFTRPAGILWTIPTLLAILHVIRLSYNKKIAIALGFLLLTCSLLSIEYVVSKSSQFNLIKPLQNGHVICGVPTESASSPSVSGSEPRSLFTPLSFILDNFSYFLAQSAKKTISFFGLYRSYYSLTHNVLLLLFIIPIYVFSIIGLLVTSKRDLTFFSIPLAGIGTTYVMVLLTCDDWHNRFSLSILSLLLILCSRGIYWTNTKLRRRQPTS